MLTNELLAYNQPNPDSQKCDYYNPPAPEKSCEFDLGDFSSCSAENNYGFSENSACIFLALHKKWDWTPEFYNSSNLPDDIPDELFRTIQHPENVNKVCCAKLLTF